MKKIVLTIAFTTIFLAAGTAFAASADTKNICPPVKAKYDLEYDAKLDALSLEELTARADKGNAAAMALLGLRYAPSPGASDGQPQVDLEKAIGLFQQAADKGNALGEYLVGVAYMSGSLAPKDEAKAAGWFKRAGDHGHAGAMYWYAQMIAKGRGGMTSDWTKALPYFRNAAAGGVGDAYSEIGHAYVTGIGGLEQDYVKAAYCYRQGSQLKSQISQFNLRTLISKGHATWQDGDPGIPITGPVEPEK